MDCTNARLLLNFLRSGELDPAERDAFEQHLESCPDCGALAQSEQRFDDALTVAMQRVPVPRTLKAGILERLVRSRRPRPWAWISAAAAACLLLVVGFGAWWLRPVEPINIPGLMYVHEAPINAEAIQDWFENNGVAMVVPPQFNINLLDGYDVVEVQKRKVARLTFVARDNIAHVYVLPKDQCPPPEEIPEKLPGSRHTLVSLRDPSFYFIVIYTGSSLAPFYWDSVQGSGRAMNTARLPIAGFTSNT